MCQFLSAVVLRNGDVLWHEATDSHSDLIAWFGLPDNRECRHFAKVEFTPGKGEAICDPASYTLRVDEETEPSWWPDVAGTVEAKLRAIVSGMIVRDKRRVLLGGRWIIADGAKVGKTAHAHIQAIWGGTVDEISGGTVDEISGGTVKAIWGGTVKEISGGTVDEISGGTVIKDYRN